MSQGLVRTLVRGSLRTYTVPLVTHQDLEVDSTPIPLNQFR